MMAFWQNCDLFQMNAAWLDKDLVIKYFIHGNYNKGILQFLRTIGKFIIRDTPSYWIEALYNSTCY